MSRSLSAALRLICLIFCIAPSAWAQVERVGQIGSPGTDADPISFTRYQGDLFFGANDRTGLGTELWAYSAQTDQTRRVVRLSPTGPGRNTGVARLIVYNDTLYFTADGDDARYELWSFASVARRITNINTGSGSSISGLTVYNGDLWMRADDDRDGAELWSYNPARPSADEVRLEVDLNPGSGDGVNLAQPVVFNQSLYFGGDDGPGTEPWRIDGQVPRLVEDLSTVFTGSNPSDFTAYDGALYFSATGSTVGGGSVNTLFVTPDGTGATRAPGASPETVGVPTGLTVYDGRLYFSGLESGTNDRELWAYDGATVTRVADLNPTGSSRPTNLVVFDGALIFSADDGQTGRELWRYDSATDTATRISDVQPGPGDGVSGTAAALPVAYAGALYFAGIQGNSGNSQLYRYRPMPVSAETAPGRTEARMTISGPNPFRARTTLRLGAGRLDVALYDALGRRVRTLFDGVAGADAEVSVDAAGLAPGVYVVRATGPSGASAQTLTVLR